MPTGCPICQEPLSPGAGACASCGFPTALALDGMKALAEAALPINGDQSPTVEIVAPSAGSVLAPDPQSALCTRLARQIDREIGTLVDLGGDPLSVASDLRQAALSQADGRVVEALGILRQASVRVLVQVEELFDGRLQEMQRRVDRLRSAGVGVSIAEPVSRIQGSVRSGDRQPALQDLVQLDERVSRLEGDFNGLQGLLRQIDSLRSALVSFVPAPAEVEADVERVRALLASPELTPQVLDEASQTAARAVMMLHEHLPPHLEAELGRHGDALEKFPEDHAGARSARALHAEAVRHLRRGRLTEASQRLMELRQAIEEISRLPPEPVPAPPVPGPSAAVTPPSRPAPVATPGEQDPALHSLLLKARGLAARVRRLPPDSELAFEAASAIRRATELLRSRKLEEADQALSRLMQTLESEPVGEA
ncbi:MAG TPA: hypothetical protein VFG07_01675 [Thermoplasmata archaeon]|nr:hypothetical protein [Thermoplasmata archaeon]